MIATVVIIALLFIPCYFGVRSLIHVFKGTERCECSGDCGKCRIKCQSNQNYYGIQKSEAEEEINGFY